MKIAFLGKGGSGKSTMATALVQHLQGVGYKVLAIDADHNMDLAYNLVAEPSVFLGADPDAIKEYVGCTREDSFGASMRSAQERGVRFNAFPADPFTEAHTTLVDDRLRLMVAGPHTERVRSQDACSHSLAAPLKTYIPLLQLRENEAVVIDERAGTDPVATGILSGVTLAVIVEEPTINSERVAKQIAHELQLANVPHIVVHNKREGVALDTKKAIEKIVGAVR
ncbi:MAG: dehydrogenase maturation factor [Patescibacteria group bacterium]|nr:dehydrogenase maturation factor [Patescibacteria group bacterium]